MKNKVLILVILAILCFISYHYIQRPDGSSVESREKILGITPEGTKWNIANEQGFNDYILSGIYSESKSGIAVFQPKGSGKYKLVSREWRDSDEIIISEIAIDGQLYDIVWFNGAAASYAEVVYTINGVKEEPIVFDTSDMGIICSKAPAKDYFLEVKYHDSAGNVYE